MSDLEMEGNPEDLITASEVAEIWNKRAEALGYHKRYTRRSVNARRTYEGDRAIVLVPAQTTRLGNLYRRSDAWTFPIRPDVGRKVSRGESLDDAA